MIQVKKDGVSMDDAGAILTQGTNLTDVLRLAIADGVEFFKYDGELYAKGDSPIGDDCVLPVIDWIDGDWSDATPV